jgi:hypothetical protein
MIQTWNLGNFKLNYIMSSQGLDNLENSFEIPTRLWQFSTETNQSANMSLVVYWQRCINYEDSKASIKNDTVIVNS